MTITTTARDIQPHLKYWTSAAPSVSSEPAMIGDVLLGWLDAYGGRKQRWPVIRTGEREPIIWPVRLAVGRRDNFSCQKCHTDVMDGFELDHITPWSAGGSDRSDNLRCLCIPCNQRRSNFHDGTEARGKTPVTWWCVQCWTDDNTSRWHENQGMDIPHKVQLDAVVAYCAHCRHISRTDVTL